MKPAIAAIKGFIAAHKLVSTAILVVLLGGGYYAYRAASGASAATRYMLGDVVRGTLVASVSGSGQVSATNQVDVHPKVSGQITAVYGKAGQAVKEGTVLAYVDSTDAQNAVRDAELSLESAKLSLERATTDSAASTLQTGNALASAEDAKKAAEDSLEEAYQDAFTAVSSAFLDMPGVVAGLDDILNNGTHSPYVSSDQIRSYGTPHALDYKDEVVKSFYDAEDASYDGALSLYRATDRGAGAEAISSLLSNTQKAAQAISDVVRETNAFVEYLKNQGAPSGQIDTDTASLAAYATTMNGTLSKLQSGADAITKAKQDIDSAGRTLAEKQQAQSDLNKVPDPLDVRSAKITVEQRQNALTKARQDLSKYAVRAPFAGVIGSTGAKAGDEASASTVVATLITKQKIAAITLNEVDVVKVQEGQKATLTFDALPDVTLTGKVLEVAGVGTVSQGVVTYGVKIGFDTGDEKVKPGMSVSASIITESRPDVLLVPSSAVRGTGSAATVQVLDNPGAPAADGSVEAGSPPRSVAVETGLSNDTDTEIVSGLAEGDKIVVRTLSGSASQSSAQRQQTNSLLNAGRPAGGGNVRFGGGGGAVIGR